MKKNAVILFNLGGPDSLDSVENFLFNLFYDKAIINLPNPLRWVIAKIISKRRVNTAKEIYHLLGGKSPLYEQTLKQADSLKEKLGEKFDIFIAMRYFHPFVKEATLKIAENKESYENIILLPLYPQFSTTTTGSSIKDFYDNYKLDIPVKTVCCYPDDEKFIKAHSEEIQNVIDKIEHEEKIIIMFSAHGLPQKIIDKGDPYQYQIELTTKEVIKSLDFKKKKIETIITYQSRVGPVKWISPYTDEEIEKFSKQNYTIVLVPIAFVSEHSETLVELDIEYKKLANEFGCRDYYRVNALYINELFIETLADICNKIAADEKLQNNAIISSKYEKICPKQFCGCLNNYVK